MKAQDLQKRNYDSKRPTVDLQVGEHVMVLMPSEIQSQERKLVWVPTGDTHQC